MDLNVQIFTGTCKNPADLEAGRVVDKLRRILERTKITSGFIGWNVDTDVSEIAALLRDSDADVYLWLPIFSELDVLAEFSPIIGSKNTEVINDRGDDETFNFCCPANPGNVDRAIDIFEKYYSDDIYDGVFIDRIRFPSFFGGKDMVFSCFCEYCRSKYDVPDPSELAALDGENPLGITRYKDLRYEMSGVYQKLFDYKSEAVTRSLERLCDYFRKRGLKIGLDLFAPFLSPFVGQDYRRLLPLADIVKPMFYKATNAPAGLPFEIGAYAAAFDDDREKADRRKALFAGIVGYDDADFVSCEISGIKKIIEDNKLKTKLYAGIELNYTDVSPVTQEYIGRSVTNAQSADGIVTSWDLNTTPDSHIDYLLDIWEQF